MCFHLRRFTKSLQAKQSVSLGPDVFWFGFFIRVRLCHDMQNGSLTKNSGCGCHGRANEPHDLDLCRMCRALVGSLANVNAIVCTHAGFRKVGETPKPKNSWAFGSLSAKRPHISREVRLDSKLHAMQKFLLDILVLRQMTAGASAAWFASRANTLKKRVQQN